jgi:DNA polymerase III subunit gamma/tau
MGKALYREYRPKSLDTVVGQEHITNTLRNAITKGTISHAYLFTGPRGVGKTSVARILAHEINGIEYNEEETQLDIIEIDAASNRRIDEIRDLRDKVHIAPTSSKYKVYIIDEVHMLTREAFNALLKTLEEPPAHAVFILATTESHKVPETIISRTQRFSFKPISGVDVAKQLRVIADKESITINEDALNLLAEHGNGSFRDSISMLDQIAGFTDEEISATDVGLLLGIPDTAVLESLLIATAKGDVEELFSSVQTLRENGSNPAKSAQLLIKQLRDHVLYGSNIFEMTFAVPLMKELLQLTGVQSSYEAIEIALLNSIKFTPNAQNNSSNIAETLRVTPTQINNEKQKETSVNLPEVHIEIPDTEIAETVEASPKEVSSSWNDVLRTLKIKHNTLYGVLRMAETKVEKNTITLTFQFEFHKKQLNIAKNIAALKAIVNEQLGTGYVIESQVVKNNKKKITTHAQTSENDTLSSVSNIFGGAELLES